MSASRGPRRPAPGRGNSRRPAAGREGAYGNRAGRGPSGPGNGGGSQGPLIALLALGGVVVLVLIIILATRGGGRNPVPAPAPASPSAGSPPPVQPDQPPPPLTPAERERIHSTVMRLAGREAEAVRLKNEGHAAHQAEDRESAQECWREARDILTGMIEESELLFEEIGYDRVERYAPTDFRITGKWSQILSEFFKYIE